MPVPFSLVSLRHHSTQRVKNFGGTLEGWNPLEWAGAMCGEAGEAANVAKKLRRIEGGCDVNNSLTPDQLKDQLVEELADVVIYADLLAASVGRRLDTAIADKFNVVSERVNYPPVAWTFQS